MAGFATGLMEGAQFQQQQEMGKLALSEGKVKLQSEELALAQTKKMLELQEQLGAKIQGLNKTGPGGGADEVVEQRAAMLDAMADLYAPSFPEQAKEYYSTASTLRKNQSEITGRIQEQRSKDMTMVADLLGNVHDFRGLQAAIQVAQVQAPHLGEQYKEFLGHIQSAEQMPNGQIKVAGRAWNVPDLVQKLRDAAISQKEQAETAQAKAHESYYKAEERVANATEPLRRAETEHQKALAEREKKEGGKPKVLSSAQIQPITDIARKKYPNATAEELRRRSLAASEDMLDFIEGGVPESEAAQRAYNRAEQRGDFAGLTKRSEIAGETVEKPLPVPAGTKLGKLKDNKWYNLGGVSRIKIDGEWWTAEELEHRDRATNNE
jgi:hypothetical protein